MYFILHLIFIYSISDALCDVEDKCILNTQTSLECDSELRHVLPYLTSDIRTLKMIGNHSVKELTKTDLKGLGQLEKLDLSNNNIENIEDYAFFDMGKLKVLDLSHNMVKEIRGTTFKGLKTLSVLNLTGNKNVNIHKKAFSDLINLEELYIPNKGLTGAKSVWPMLKRLVIVDITKIPIKNSLKDPSTLNDFTVADSNPKITRNKIMTINARREGQRMSSLKVPRKRRDVATTISHQSCIRPTVTCTYNVYSEVNKTFTFPCNISGNPFPKVYLQLNGSTKAPTYYNVNKSKGTITLTNNVTENDFGQWKIVVMNSCGRVPGGFRLFRLDPTPKDEDTSIVATAVGCSVGGVGLMGIAGGIFMKRELLKHLICKSKSVKPTSN